ncbi:hypothetical protein IJ674_09870 [bacterium]|nr:hypothetical protein [bacterium]
MQDFDYCKSEFEWFLSVQYKDIPDLKDKINEFCHNFCFDDLYDKEKIDILPLNEQSKERYYRLSFGSNSKNVWDCDDTHLARMIYFLIHRDVKNNKYSIPDLVNFTDIGSGYKYKYRGDTLNTYSTLFGSLNQGYGDYFMKYGIEDSRVEIFRRKYVTIGNFMLLPAISIQLDPDKRKWDSINTYRGMSERYRDFFDLFLYKFINKLDFNQWRDLEETKNYFSVMNDNKKFIEKNILECYLDVSKNVPQNLFGHFDTEHPFCWWNIGANANDTNYREFAIRYVNKATEIIDYRADIICKILQNLYL